MSRHSMCGIPGARCGKSQPDNILGLHHHSIFRSDQTKGHTQSAIQCKCQYKLDKKQNTIQNYKKDKQTSYSCSSSRAKVDKCQDLNKAHFVQLVLSVFCFLIKSSFLKKKIHWRNLKGKFSQTFPRPWKTIDLRSINLWPLMCVALPNRNTFEPLALAETLFD